MKTPKKITLIIGFATCALANAQPLSIAGSLQAHTATAIYTNDNQAFLWVLAAFALGIGCISAHRLRLYHLEKQLSIRFDERMAERTRIAQDLHDTLLQGMLSASMQLYAASREVPADLPARRQLTDLNELIRQVIDEGRDVIRGLRSSSSSDDLEAAFASLREQRIIPCSTEFRVIVEGEPRSLNPLVSDDVYRIGREALVNSFRHSEATLVDVVIQYASSLHVIVRDNGRGIDADILHSGRQGHWGLVGMRERAARIGSRLNVCSSIGKGTEVELAVPGKIAFSHEPAIEVCNSQRQFGRHAELIPVRIACRPQA